jgi:hypothetical protein
LARNTTPIKSTRVIPARAGIQETTTLDTGLRRCDDLVNLTQKFLCHHALRERPMAKNKIGLRRGDLLVD